MSIFKVLVRGRRINELGVPARIGKSECWARDKPAVLCKIVLRRTGC